MAKRIFGLGMLAGALALALAFGVVLAGCGGGKNPEKITAELTKLQEQAAELAQGAGDPAKAAKLAEQMAKLTAELEKAVKSGGAAAKKAAGAAKGVPGAITTPQEALNAIVEDNKNKEHAVEAKLWEAEVTETDADRAVGWITRGKANLKVTGPITNDQLGAIGEAMDSMKSGDFYLKSFQLFRLDLSAVTGLTEIEDYISFPYVGALVLPDGLKKLGKIDGTGYLTELILPASLESMKSIGGTELTKLVLPVSLENSLYEGRWMYGPLILIGSPKAQFTAVLSDGVEAIDLMRISGMKSDVEVAEEDRKFRSVTLVLPATLKRFFVSNMGEMGKLNAGVQTIYCYAATPPVYELSVSFRNELKSMGSFSEADMAEYIESNAQLCLENVKTIYVPAGSEKAYEDAWFTYTSAEFKPIPAAFATIDKWY
jgi:hypothetical protein